METTQLCVVLVATPMLVHPKTGSFTTFMGNMTRHVAPEFCPLRPGATSSTGVHQHKLTSYHSSFRWNQPSWLFIFQNLPLRSITWLLVDNRQQLAVSEGRFRLNVQKTKAFDLGLHQRRCRMTTRRSGSVGSTDGACNGGLFFSGSGQERQSHPSG